MPDLLSVEQALARILARIPILPHEYVPVVDSLGRVLAADVSSTVDIPPFANSSMDGYAVRAADVSTASADSPVHLVVVTDIPAGEMSDQVLKFGQAARIMTGAPMPPGADAVVPVEYTSDDWRSDGTSSPAESVSVFRDVQPGDFTRAAGEDIRQGETVLHAGMLVRPQDLGVLVSIGVKQMAVFRRPRVAILATGNELVDQDEDLGPGQIRNSNSYVLAGLVAELGGIPLRLPVARDNLDAVRARFQEALAAEPDLIISSAGVSVGTRDVVRSVVEEMGEIAFWRVNVRPGKPLVFGLVQDVPFFGLPGNPVSSMVTFEVFVRPVMRRMLNSPVERQQVVTAVAGESVSSDGRRTFMRVRLEKRDGILVAVSTGTQSSGALMSMVKADGLMVIPEGVTSVSEGTTLQVWLLRDSWHAFI